MTAKGAKVGGRPKRWQNNIPLNRMFRLSGDGTEYILERSSLKKEKERCEDCCLRPRSFNCDKVDCQGKRRGDNVNAIVRLA